MNMQISICLLTNEQTNVLIMDFSKAFDKVSHSLLMHTFQISIYESYVIYCTGRISQIQQTGKT
jgi:hypothetical protein